MNELFMETFKLYIFTVFNITFTRNIFRDVQIRHINFLVGNQKYLLR